jgi:hypothetical protein
MKLGLKLGSDPFKHGALKLEEYVTDQPPVVPGAVTLPNASTYRWGMLGNNQIGDCMIAALYHADESFYLRRGLQPYPYQSPECVLLYSQITGYNPNDPSTDQGTDPSVAMAWWRDKGLPGHKILGFGQLPGSSPHIRRAIWEFGAVIFALALPDDWQSMVGPDGVAHFAGSTPGDPNNGHAIVANQFDSSGFGIVTWGEEGTQDNAFTQACLEQVFVPLSSEALNQAGVGPAGFNLAQMRQDLPAL